MAERLAGGNVAITLLANTAAAVSVAMTVRGELPASELLPYSAVQLIGAVLGAWLARDC
jgi:glycerol uptake facilitator-like aquaporin